MMQFEFRQLGPLPQQQKNMDPRVLEALDARRELAVLQGIIGSRAPLSQPKDSDTITQRAGKLSDSLARREVQELQRKIDQVDQDQYLKAQFDQEYARRTELEARAREVLLMQRLIHEMNLTELRVAAQSEYTQEIRAKSTREIRTRIEQAADRCANLLKEPGVYYEFRREQLLDYRRQLDTGDHFVELPSRLEIEKQVMEGWFQGKAVLLTGHTGTGKTELMKHAARKMNGKEPYILNGREDLLAESFVGDVMMRDGTTVFLPSQVTQAATEGNGWIYDEANNTPNRTNMALKPIFNLKPGTPIAITSLDGNGVETTYVAEGYFMGATQNPAGDKYDREETWAEFDTNFSHPPEVRFPPAYEMYDLALAALLDSKGGIELSKEEAEGTLYQLCEAAKEVQRAFTGQGYIDGGGTITLDIQALRKSNLHPGKLLNMIRGWQGINSRESFETYISRQLLNEYINNPNLPGEDRMYLLGLFIRKGFFKGFQVEDFVIAGRTTKDIKDDISGWGFSLSQVKPAPTGEYLYPEEVVRLDPYRQTEKTLRLLSLSPDTGSARPKRMRPAVLTEDADPSVAVQAAHRRTVPAVLQQVSASDAATVRSLKGLRFSSTITALRKPWFKLPFIGARLDDGDDFKWGIVNYAFFFTKLKAALYERALTNRQNSLERILRSRSTLSVGEWTLAADTLYRLAKRQKSGDEEDGYFYRNSRSHYIWGISDTVTTLMINRFPQIRTVSEIESLYRAVYKYAGYPYDMMRAKFYSELYAQYSRSTNPEVEQKIRLTLRDFFASREGQKLGAQYFGSQLNAVKQKLGI